MATLAGKHIVVIGGSAGIGYAVARAALLDRAAHVRIASSSQARVDAAVARLLADPALRAQGRVSGARVDLGDAANVAAYFAKLGPVDHLVVTSGALSHIGDYRASDLSKARDLFDVRFWGPAEAAQKAQIRPGGSITFTTGTALQTPPATWSLVVGALGAIDALTRALAVELAPLRVNVVAPGAADTELWDGMPKEAKDARLAGFAAKLPVGHVATPDEIAEAYLFLMKCNYVTGQRIVVDGGGVLLA